MPRQLHPTHRLEAKQKGVQKPDGYKNLAKRRKSGVQRSRKRWGREPPRNPRCKEAVERGRWPIKAPPTNGESHTTVGPASGSWGGDGQLRGGGRTGKNRGAPRRGGGSAPQQCGERGPCARSLYSVTLRVSAPFPPTPQEPRLFDARPGDLIHM